MENSTDKPAATLKSEAPPPRVVDVALRVSLFAATLVAVIVMVTSKQTELVPVPGAPVGVRIPHTAKFHHSPPFVYFVAALSVACLYSIITTLASFTLHSKPAFSNKFFLHFAFLDTLIFGVVASAMGAASAEAYNGFRGNHHVGWSKVCPTFDKFCVHAATSTAMSLLASIILVFLIMLSFFSLYKRGLVGSATGASAAVAYIGLKGNNHTGWLEICSIYGKFCRHVGSASAVALVASILLVLLSVLSTYSLYKRVRD